MGIQRGRMSFTFGRSGRSIRIPTAHWKRHTGREGSETNLQFSVRKVCPECGASDVREFYLCVSYHIFVSFTNPSCDYFPSGRFIFCGYDSDGRSVFHFKTSDLENLRISWRMGYEPEK